MIRVCFVCLGNICRSPIAEGVMRHLVAAAGLSSSITVDSAGTGAYHVGDPPDPRSRAAAGRRGIVVEGRARQFTRDDFARFDHVIAMDADNLADLLDLAPDAAAAEKTALLRAFDPESPERSSVPDPYYGGPQGFTEVVDLCLASCRGLVEHLRRTHGL